MQKKLFLVFLLIFVGANLFAETGEAYHGANFLKIRPGARANSLGLAYLGFSDDTATVFWNPAGIVTLNGSSFMGGISSNLGFDQLSAYAAWVLKGQSYGIGIGGFLTHYPFIAGYDSLGAETKDIFNIQGYGVLDFSFYLTDFSSMGIGVKGGYQRLGDKNLYVLGGNLGLMLQFLYFQFVLSLENMGISVKSEDQKTQYLNPDLSFGISYTKNTTEGDKSFGISFVASKGVDLPSDSAKLGVGSFICLWSESPQVEDFFNEKKGNYNAFFINLGLESYHGIAFSGGFTLLLFNIKLDYALIFPTRSKEEFFHHASLEFQF